MEGLSKWATFRIKKNEVVKNYCKAIKMNCYKKKLMRWCLFRRVIAKVYLRFRKEVAQSIYELRARFLKMRLIFFIRQRLMKKVYSARNKV